MANNTFKLRIRDAQKIIFEGEVDRITSYNDVGQFDVYPQHANFISIIKKGLSIYKNRQKIQDVSFEQAVLKVKQDTAKVFLGIEVIPLEDNTPKIQDKKPIEK